MDLVKYIEFVIRKVELAVQAVEQTWAELCDDDILEIEVKKHNNSSNSSSSSGEDGGEEATYTQAMKPLQYSEIDNLSNYHYRTVLNTASMGGSGALKARCKRLAQEHSDLSHTLPLSWSSSVWLRASTERMDALQVTINILLFSPSSTSYHVTLLTPILFSPFSLVTPRQFLSFIPTFSYRLLLILVHSLFQFMISGPEDTPYSNGLFLFDAFFPETYPTTAPKVNLQTTGKGNKLHQTSNIFFEICI